MLRGDNILLTRDFSLTFPPRWFYSGLVCFGRFWVWCWFSCVGLSVEVIWGPIEFIMCYYYVFFFFFFFFLFFCWCTSKLFDTQQQSGSHGRLSGSVPLCVTIHRVFKRAPSPRQALCTTIHKLPLRGPAAAVMNSSSRHVTWRWDVCLSSCLSKSSCVWLGPNLSWVELPPLFIRPVSLRLSNQRLNRYHMLRIWRSILWPHLNCLIHENMEGIKSWVVRSTKNLGKWHILTLC